MARSGRRTSMAANRTFIIEVWWRHWYWVGSSQQLPVLYDWSWGTNCFSLTTCFFQYHNISHLTSDYHIQGDRNLWGQRFCVLFLEICTPSLFSPSPLCGAIFRTKQALNLWHHKYLAPCILCFVFSGTCWCARARRCWGGAPASWTRGPCNCSARRSFRSVSH